MASPGEESEADPDIGADMGYRFPVLTVIRPKASGILEVSHKTGTLWKCLSGNFTTRSCSSWLPVSVGRGLGASASASVMRGLCAHALR